MKQAATIKKACQVLRRRVRYDGAGLRMNPNASLEANDTPAIQKATSVYVESWIIPIINGIEEGNLSALHNWLLGERGHAKNMPWPPTGYKNNDPT